MTEGNGRNRRQFTRKPVALVINYETMEQFFEDYVSNISLGGVFIATARPLPTGSKLKVKFNLPELDRVIETTGIVAHVVNPEDNGGVKGMGIRFDDLDGNSKELIDQMVGSEELSSVS